MLRLKSIMQFNGPGSLWFQCLYLANIARRYVSECKEAGYKTVESKDRTRSGLSIKPDQIKMGLGRKQGPAKLID